MTLGLMKKLNLRYWAGRLHLWLGLPAGVVLFIVALTGAIYALRPEVDALGRPDLSVRAEGRRLLAPQELITAVRGEVFASPQDSSNAIYGVTYYGTERAAVVGAKIGKSRHSSLFVDPYSGTLLHKETPGYDLFRWAMTGHRTLWLPREVGKPIIGWSVLIFIIITITGLILWLPQRWNKKNIKAATTIKWTAKPARRWLDVHNVLGFYSAAFALAIAITGLTWSFDWWGNGYYSLLTGGDTLQKWSVPSSDTLALRPYANTDSIMWERALSMYPLKNDGSSLRLDVPQKPDGTYTVAYNPDGDLAYGHVEYHFYDRYSLQPLDGGGLYGKRQAELSWGERLYRMNYDIHSGSVGGIVGRYIAFTISIIIAILPITGIYLWTRNRKKKSIAN